MPLLQARKDVTAASESLARRGSGAHTDGYYLCTSTHKGHGKRRARQSTTDVWAQGSLLLFDISTTAPGGQTDGSKPPISIGTDGPDDSDSSLLSSDLISPVPVPVPVPVPARSHPIPSHPIPSSSVQLVGERHQMQQTAIHRHSARFLCTSAPPNLHRHLHMPLRLQSALALCTPTTSSVPFLFWNPISFSLLVAPPPAPMPCLRACVPVIVPDTVLPLRHNPPPSYSLPSLVW